MLIKLADQLTAAGRKLVRDCDPLLRDMQVALLGSGLGGRRFGSLKMWTILGCLGSALALLSLTIAGISGPPWPLRACVGAAGRMVRGVASSASADSHSARVAPSLPTEYARPPAPSMTRATRSIAFAPNSRRTSANPSSRASKLRANRSAITQSKAKA